MLIFSERNTKERHRAIKLVIPEGWVGGKGRVMQRRATTHLVYLLYSFVFWGYINEPHIKNNIKIVTGEKSGIIFSLTSLSLHRIKVRWFDMCQMALFIFWSKCILELMPCSGLRVPYSSFISTTVIKSKAMWRRRRFISACSFNFQPITVGSQGRDSTQSQEQGETQACSLAFTQLDFSILRQFRTSCLGNDGARSGLDLPTSICLINTIFHRHAQRPTQCRQFLNENSLPGDSSMCQTNKANDHTPFSSVWQQFHGKVELSI